MDSLTVFALVLFAATYILMFTLQKLRPYIALASAAIFVIVGSTGVFDGFSYSFVEALGEIDWNVIIMKALFSLIHFRSVRSAGQNARQISMHLN